MHRLKSAILAIFQRGLGWPCRVSLALKNAFEKLFLFRVSMNHINAGRQKNFMLQYCKITVCASKVAGDAGSCEIDN